MIDVIAKLPDCAGQAADAVSAYTQVKMEDAPRLLKIPKSECPDIRIRLPRHNWPKSWTNIDDPVVPHELYGHPFAGLWWRSPFEKVLLGDLDGKKYRIENVCLFIGNKDYSCRYTWMTSKWLEESRICVPCGRN